MTAVMVKNDPGTYTETAGGASKESEEQEAGSEKQVEEERKWAM
jgi:hypothetical protein